MKSNQIRDNINKLLSKKKRLLAYATAFTLATSSLTGCSEELLPEKATVEQNHDKQNKPDKPVKTFSYDELANSYYISIYNIKEDRHEPYFCKEEMYVNEDQTNRYYGTETRSKLVDIDTKKEIVFGFKPESGAYNVDHIDDIMDARDYEDINGKFVRKVWVKACHDNTGDAFFCNIFHHLGSSYELDHENEDHHTDLCIYGKVKDFLNPEDKKSRYTKEEYDQLKASIVEKYHILKQTPAEHQVKTKYK